MRYNNSTIKLICQYSIKKNLYKIKKNLHKTIDKRILLCYNVIEVANATFEGGDIVAYDYSELLGKIKTKYGTQHAFADALGITPNSLSAKIQHKSDWGQNEMYKACELLDIPRSKIPIYFFSL